MDAWDLAGKQVLITGGTSGIGRSAAAELARRGADVMLTTRDRGKGEAAAAWVAAESGREVEVGHLELHSLASIREFVEWYPHDRLDVLVNNAGVYTGRRRETPDGLEWTMGVNHFGPFLLTNLLLRGPMSDGPRRVLSVGSENHRRAKKGIDFDDLQMTSSFSPSKAYAVSKVATILFTFELDRRFAAEGLTARALHPGVVGTAFASGPEGSKAMSVVMRLLGRFFKTPEEGAETTVLLASAGDDVLSEGLYWSEGEPSEPLEVASDPAAARRLWEVSEQLVGLG